MAGEYSDIGSARTEAGDKRPLLVGPYVLGNALGAGGMGVVFTGHRPGSDRKLAIKLMRDDVGSSASTQRFLREARALASLSHPAIVEYVDHGVTDDGHAFLVMVWLEGEDLQTRLKRGPLPIDECVRLGMRLADALVAAHSQGMVHRDIKPSNIFLADHRVDEARLLDFGVARVRDDTLSLTRTGAMVGTVGYMAPEQARGESNIDGRSDLYSLGSVLYECLTGQPVFSGEHAMAVLAKILLDEAPKVTATRPEVPEQLSVVIASLLAKNPDARPTTASALLTALASLDAIDIAGPADAIAASERGVTLAEQCVYCLLLVRLASIGKDVRGRTEATSPVQVAELEQIAGEFGAAFSPMIGGVGLINVQLDAPATDVAVQAARCAVALRHRFPTLAQVLVTGRGQRCGASFVGRLIDEAMEIEASALEGAILVDEVTVGLLHDRFTIEGHGEVALLGVERDILVTRMLLGRPSPFVGRARELGILQGLVHEAIEESRSCVALVMAGPGCGKSRLRHELHRLLCEEGLDLLTLVSRGAPLTQGAALGLVRDAIRREIEMDGTSGEPRERLRRRLGGCLPPSERDRVIAFLGELCGINSEDPRPGLAMARNDALVKIDGIRVAWLDWLRAECARRPVLMLVEDLHWGDSASVALIEAALRDLRDSPFIVLALARPEVQAMFPRLWVASRPTIIELPPISQRAGEALARQVLGAGIDDIMLSNLVRHADGNPFFLEEILRAVADGSSDTLPDSVLGVIQDRLRGLDDEARRVLRAASVFGGNFTEAGVAAVLVQPTPSVRTRLTTLTQQELLSREFRPDGAHYRFRHALVRDACHAMLTEHDQELAHRLAAAWLAKQDGGEPMEIAEHYRRGGRPAQALEWFHRAARQALDGGDMAAAVERAEQAILCGALGPQAAELRLLQAESRIWSGSLDEAERWLEEALQALTPGGLRWYVALQKTIYCACVRGALDVAWARLEQAERQPPDEDASIGPLLCLCEATYAMHVAGQIERLEWIVARLQSRATRVALPPGYRGHVLKARAFLAGDLGRYEEGHLLAMEAAAEFNAGGDLRNGARVTVMASHCLFHLGATDEAIELLRKVEVMVSRLDAEQVLIYLRITLGWILSWVDHVNEARVMLTETLELCETRGDLRAKGLTAIHLGIVAWRADDLAEAEAWISRGLPLIAGQMHVLTWAQAVLARVYLAAGRFDEAVRTADCALIFMIRNPIEVNHQTFVCRAIIECLAHDQTLHSKALEVAMHRLRRQLASFLTDTRRCAYLKTQDCISLIECARRKGLAVEDLYDQLQWNESMTGSAGPAS